MSTTIPKKLFVTIQYRKDASTESGLLGFASPYTKDAAFEKRKATQESWAYYGTTFKINDDDSIEVAKQSANGIDVSELFISKCYPQIVSNEPLEGFEIAKSVRRHGWGGSGNVVWRLADPRGFELEISSDNFASIVDCTTIVNGVIQGKCVWGRSGAKNVLLPEASQPYQDALKLTAQVNANLTVADITTGDVVELLNKGLDQQYEYMGNFKVHAVKGIEMEKYYINEYQLLGSVKDRYIFKDVKTGRYTAVSTPKVGAIVTKGSGPLDKVKTAEMITRECRGTLLSIYESITLVSTTKASIKDTTFELVDTDFVFATNFPTVLGKYEHSPATECLFYEYADKLWISTTDSHYDYTSGRYGPLLVAVDKEKLLQGVVQYLGTQTTIGSGYYSRQHFQRTTMVPGAGMKFKKLMMKVGTNTFAIDQVL